MHLYTKELRINFVSNANINEKENKFMNIGYMFLKNFKSNFDCRFPGYCIGILRY